VTGSSGSTTGNAATATALQTARTINGVSFNGTANITVAAAAGTLTGTTLASNVVSSSLTSVGTLTSLAVSGNLTVDTNTLFVDSTNNRVGLGTLTPDSILHMASASTLNWKLQNTGAGGATVGSFAGVGAGSIGSISNDPFFFFTNNVERMRLDASGNLGLGVTPSAWTTNAKAFQFGNVGTVFRNDSGAVNIGQNLYESAANTYRYLVNFFATRYEQQSGAHLWYTAPSGTAGNAISFTQAMTLDASGRLGIGVTSPGVALDVQNASTTQIRAVMTGTNGAEIRMLADTSVGIIGTYNNFPLSLRTNGTERATLTTGGNLLLGGINDYARLTVSAADAARIALVAGATRAVRIGADSTAAYIEGVDQTGVASYQPLYVGGSLVALFTGGSERARITSGGYFKASNNGAYYNSANPYHETRQTASNWCLLANNSNATPYGHYVLYDTDTNNTGSEFLYCVGNATLRASIRSNGGLANYQANNVSLSDVRIKKEITPLASYWNKLKAIEIVTFKYNDQTHDDLNIGVIAQQVEAVAPELVDVDGFGETPDDGVPLKTIYTTDLYHASIRALQEAMLRIETLEAQVAALGA
jgi:hypothetical protein